jgi:hypothetical protein
VKEALIEEVFLKAKRDKDDPETFENLKDSTLNSGKVDRHVAEKATNMNHAE